MVAAEISSSSWAGESEVTKSEGEENAKVEDKLTKHRLGILGGSIFH